MATITGHLEVCIDCHMTHHQGEAPEASDQVPWGLLPGADVADASDGEGDVSFGSWPCEGCGSTLAGDRFPYVIFE